MNQNKLLVKYIFFLSVLSSVLMAFTPNPSVLKRNIGYATVGGNLIVSNGEGDITLDEFLHGGINQNARFEWEKTGEDEYILSIIIDDRFKNKRFVTKLLLRDNAAQNYILIDRVLYNNKEFYGRKKNAFIRQIYFRAQSEQAMAHPKPYDPSSMTGYSTIPAEPIKPKTMDVPTSKKSKYSHTFDTCMDQSNGTTSSMRACHETELSMQDKRLNKNYKKLMHLLDDDKKVEMKKVQRAWIKYRDLRCGFYYGLTGGTMDLLAGDGCVLDMTIEKANELFDISDSI